MKLLAIIDVAPSAPMEIVRNELANELKQSWSLFASGTLREAEIIELRPFVNWSMLFSG
jgi:hypothetical protein